MPLALLSAVAANSKQAGKQAAAGARLHAAIGNASLSGAPLPRQCANCTHELTLSMVCHPAKHGFFHRVFNCLMPMLAMLPIVERNQGACLFGMRGAWGVLDFVQPLLADVVPPNHPWRLIEGMRFGGDAGVCMGRLLPRRPEFGTGWNYSWPDGGGGTHPNYNGTDYLAGDLLPPLRRYPAGLSLGLGLGLSPSLSLSLSRRPAAAASSVPRPSRVALPHGGQPCSGACLFRGIAHGEAGGGPHLPQEQRPRLRARRRDKDRSMDG